MMQSSMATGAPIFALATGAGRAAVAVMRVSGTGTGAILSTLCGGRVPPPRSARLRTLQRTIDGRCVALDHALVLWFPAPGSYTGEDSCELHLHAGPGVIDAVGDALVALGARPAEPGEFTRRAFEHGRLDLIQAEGIADLIEAETESQRRQALEQADGALSRVYSAWAERLKTLLARQEALIDFPDEEIPPEVERAVLDDVRALIDETGAHLDDAGRGERLRRGLVFAIVGAPNVGKSTLLNYLADRDAAIVSDVAGTTRDAIEVRAMLGSVPVTLVDTAGLRETADPIEAEGIRRALFHVKQADWTLHLFDGPDIPPMAVGNALPVHTKADLAAGPPGVLSISVQTGHGLAILRDVLAAQATALTARQGTPPLTRARHRAGIEETRAALMRALAQDWPEMRGEDLRLAMRALGRLTGQVGVEDLLDSVFGQFCIGK
ncbi:tRNA uridine-5-carboxymethylaminomethyl(34) synthesis GTPase MnmE [Ameyamaea chiangmaiensis]